MNEGVKRGKNPLLLIYTRTLVIDRENCLFPVPFFVVVVCGVLYRAMIGPPCSYPPGSPAGVAQYWI